MVNWLRPVPATVLQPPALSAAGPSATTGIPPISQRRKFLRVVPSSGTLGKCLREWVVAQVLVHPWPRTIGLVWLRLLEIAASPAGVRSERVSWFVGISLLRWLLEARWQIMHWRRLVIRDWVPVSDLSLTCTSPWLFVNGLRYGLRENEIWV